MENNDFFKNCTKDELIFLIGVYRKNIIFHVDEKFEVLHRRINQNIADEKVINDKMGKNINEYSEILKKNDGKKYSEISNSDYKRLKALSEEYDTLDKLRNTIQKTYQKLNNEIDKIIDQIK